MNRSEHRIKVVKIRICASCCILRGTRGVSRSFIEKFYAEFRVEIFRMCGDSAGRFFFLSFRDKFFIEFQIQIQRFNIIKDFFFFFFCMSAGLVDGIDKIIQIEIAAVFRRPGSRFQNGAFKRIEKSAEIDFFCFPGACSAVCRNGRSFRLLLCGGFPGGCGCGFRESGDIGFFKADVRQGAFRLRKIIQTGTAAVFRRPGSRFQNGTFKRIGKSAGTGFFCFTVACSAACCNRRSFRLLLCGSFPGGRCKVFRREFADFFAVFRRNGGKFHIPACRFSGGSFRCFRSRYGRFYGNFVKIDVFKRKIFQRLVFRFFRTGNQGRKIFLCGNRISGQKKGRDVFIGNFCRTGAVIFFCRFFKYGYWFRFGFFPEFFLRCSGYRFPGFLAG